MHRVYCLPGLGTDKRLLKDLVIDNCELIILKWISPYNGETLKYYALRLAEKIDTSQPFSLLGVSFGGMCMVEIAKVYKPEKVILISSAKTADELPLYIRMFKYFPLHKVLPEYILKKGSRLVKNFFGRLDKIETKLLLEMLDAMPEQYIPNAIHCVLHWDNSEVPDNIVHIHGDKDRIIRVEDVSKPKVIKGGTHFMILQKADEINTILKQVFSK